MIKKLTGLFTALAFTVWAGAGNAALVTRHFEFGADLGPLAPFTDTGSFTFDNSIIPVGGGSVSDDDLLIELQISVGGVDFDETTANTGAISFNALGDIDYVYFGTDCEPGVCLFTPGNWTLSIGPTVSDGGLFAYTTEDDVTYRNRGRNRLLPLNAVPIPAAVWLFGSALFGLGVIKRKRV